MPVFIGFSSMTKEVMVAAKRATWKARLLLRDQSRAPSQRDWTHVAHGEGAAEAPCGRGANFPFFSVSLYFIFCFCSFGFFPPVFSFVQFFFPVSLLFGFLQFF